MLQTSDLVGKPFEEIKCWELAVEVFRRAEIVLPDYATECGAIETGVTEKRNQWVRCAGNIPVPALIVFMSHGICDHVGVYLGGGKFIHAHEASGVTICRTDHPAWKRRIEGYYVPGWR
jgi:cell wall-associated NlpC family hydrolase